MTGVQGTGVGVAEERSMKTQGWARPRGELDFHPGLDWEVLEHFDQSSDSSDLPFNRLTLWVRGRRQAS